MLTKIIIAVLCLVCIPFILVICVLIQNDLPWTEPPGFVVRLQHYMTTNVAETVNASSYPELIIREYDYPNKQFLQLLEASAKKLGWDVEVQDEQPYTLKAVITTPLIGFKDDVIVKLIPMTENRNKLYIRSSSRKGRGDLGTNSRHIMDLYNQIEKQMTY